MNAPAHLLLVEDEPKIATAMRDWLVAAGYAVDLRERGDGVVEEVRRQAPDLLLLDLMLPGEDGLSICRRIREFSELPIILVTARVEEIDRLLGLDLGADDYICKPFSLRELGARVRALLRRTRPSPRNTAPECGIVLDADRFEVRVAGRPLALTPVEFRLLRRLMEKPGKVYSRGQLLDASYEDHRVVSDRTVDSHVRNLRRKFGEAGLDPIESVYGVGFRFELAREPQ
ncbi:two-component system response regulator BaeR [Tahibacter aquaticus]|uniref:Two-component system response regulator BaeR n=1 Tax=Tahibacter aquaticus TaxID=520092 RepID=A0A4R6YSR1_9GAMM|nr:response regulator [Tahibacter aquaticus]TDR41299.1 two-component system response regulator BaeR [Tahibacter aquaticus]